MKKQLEKIHVYANNKSLRWKLMFTIFLSVLFIILSICVNGRINHYSMGIIGNSYRSNVQISVLCENLDTCEHSLEHFVNFYTFDDVNTFRTYGKKIREFLGSMASKPSDDRLGGKEYIIVQLIESWLSFSEKVIYARSSNSLEELKFYYERASECYDMLKGEISGFEEISLKSNSELYEKNKHNLDVLSTLTYTYFFSVFFLLLAYTFLMITEILLPLNNISETASLVAEKNFDVPLFNSESNNEIGTICRAFDRMIISINEYIGTIQEKAKTETELKEKQIEMQRLYSDAKINALQSQISPHFLFNTLNTGVQLAMLEGADKTGEFIEQVASFFRYNIRAGQMAQTIDDELKQNDHFVYIMSVRFGSRLVFKKDVPPKSFPQKIPSMTLQPLVENCIKHGLMNSTGVVTLSIEERGSFIQITVSDNGQGFSAEKREEILKSVREETVVREKSSLVSTESESTESKELPNRDDNNGIGLKNVFSRLKLFYQRDDIFDIQQNFPGTGAKFVIKVPKDV